MPLNIGTQRALLKQQKVWSVQFYTENDGIDFGSGVDIDDLFAADCTLEFYVAIPVLGNVVWPLSKNDGAPNNGWRFSITAGNVIGFNAYFVTNSLAINTGVIRAGRQYHVAVDWELATLTGRIFLDGIFQTQDVAVGAYQVDAARDLICNGLGAIGVVDSSMQIGPIRLSNSRRYTGASFNPPTMNHWPENDAGAQLITRMNDAEGVTVTDYSGNGNNGTITFGANTRWYHGPK